MLLKDSEPSVREFDELVYRQVVPRDHYLRKVLEIISWDSFYDLLAPYYSLDAGRPAESPVMMLKLEYLRYHHNLSDREVIARSVTDLAFRNFLRIPLRGYLPDPSTLCVFRGRLGREGFRNIFARVVQIAREYGVVKDRMRLKDATHVIGNIAVPSTLALVAQIRDKLLSAAAPFAPQMVEGERVNLELLREATKGLNPKEKLVTRVAQLRENLVWADTLTPPKQAETNRPWQLFLAQRDLAHKILEDLEHPNAGDRTISVIDPDARSAKHGDWYDGYLVDVLFDPDSELVTSINVLPAARDEAVDTLELVHGEEAAHGNQIEALSMDGAGFNGPLLRELEAPEGLNIDTYVPPPADSKSGLFTPRDFQEDPEQRVVTCPAGQTSTQYQYEPKERSRVYRFSATTCRSCPLLAQCMKQPPRRRGRTVRKTEYQAEHDRVRLKATTPAYARVRREHLKVERKLGELVNRHAGRRARYWGIPKVFIQEAMACTAMNIKRLVRLTCAPTAEACG